MTTKELIKRINILLAQASQSQLELILRSITNILK